VALLLAVALMNALVICTAAVPVTATPAHHCCPITPGPTPAPCSKIGCFMSGPFLATQTHSADPPAMTAVPVNGWLSDSAVVLDRIPRPCVWSGDLPVCFHQLLI